MNFWHFSGCYAWLGSNSRFIGTQVGWIWILISIPLRAGCAKSHRDFLANGARRKRTVLLLRDRNCRFDLDFSHHKLWAPLISILTESIPSSIALADICVWWKVVRLVVVIRNLLCECCILSVVNSLDLIDSTFCNFKFVLLAFHIVVFDLYPCSLLAGLNPFQPEPPHNHINSTKFTNLTTKLTKSDKNLESAMKFFAMLLASANTASALSINVQESY